MGDSAGWGAGDAGATVGSVFGGAAREGGATGEGGAGDAGARPNATAASPASGESAAISRTFS